MVCGSLIYDVDTASNRTVHFEVNNSASTTSVAAGDFDGDGLSEIIVVVTV